MADSKNPFQILNLSIHATKTEINDRADELSFEKPDDEETIEQARSLLLNPRKRIAAEVHALAEKSIFTNQNILQSIYVVDKNFSTQNAEEIREKINTARLKSKFPVVQNTTEIKVELTNIRYEIREKIQFGLKNMNHDECVKLANDIAWKIDDENFGIIVEDFFECYRLETNPFFEEIRNEIISLTIKIKLNAGKKLLDELDKKVTTFADATKPLNRVSMTIGANKFSETENIFYVVRSVAIDLYNKKNLIEEPLTITGILDKNFSYLPEFKEKIQEDLKILENLPSQNFQKTFDALETISETMDKQLHLENGYEQVNLDFYNNEFKPRHEFTLLRVMNISKEDFRLNEWKALHLATSNIYLKMGNALTFTSPSEFGLNAIREMYQKALIYAEATDDKKLIADTQEYVDSWKNVDLETSTQQTVNQSSDDSAGCITIIVFAVIGTFIGGPFGTAVGIWLGIKISQNK